MLFVFGKSYLSNSEIWWRGRGWIRKIRKIWITHCPIGNFGVRPKTRCPGVKPSYWCTCELRCKAAIAENSPHCLFGKLFDLRFPIIWSIIPRKWACLRSVAPRLWWCPGITVCSVILRTVQKSWNKFPMNLLSLSTIKISGAPNTANQFEIAVSRTISAVFSSRFFVPRKLITEKREKCPECVRRSHDPRSLRNPFQLAHWKYWQ